MKRLLFSAALLALALSAFPMVASADGSPVLSGYAYLMGTHQPLSNAEVVVSSASARYSGRTDANGHFVFFGLPSDRYDVTVHRNGYDLGVVFGVAIAPEASQYVVLPMETARPDGHTLGYAISDDATLDVF